MKRGSVSLSYATTPNFPAFQKLNGIFQTGPINYNFIKFMLQIQLLKKFFCVWNLPAFGTHKIPGNRMN